MMEKKTPPPPKLSATIKLLKFSWPLFSWWTSWMNELSLYVYLKKWIIVAIVNKLTLVYFIRFVHNLVNHKYNVLLKKNDVCSIPIKIFVCVFHVHSPWRLNLSGTVGMSGNRSKMLCWSRFFPLPNPFILFRH